MKPVTKPSMSFSFRKASRHIAIPTNHSAACSVNGVPIVAMLTASAIAAAMPNSAITGR